jgi:hypothetical protein
MTSPTLHSGGASPFAKALPVIAVVVFWAVIELAFIWGGYAPILKGEFVDADGYARLLRVINLVQTGNWYDGSLPRSNWPYGEALHWTRPLDVVLLAGTALLRPFMNFQDALFWFGSAVSPLLCLAAIFAVSWMVEPLLEAEGQHEAGFLLLLQPGVVSYTVAGRPDHHGLLFLMFILACGFSLRALARPENGRAAFCAGLAIAFGLWVEVELLITLAVALFVFGILWLREGERWVLVNRRLAMGFLLMVAIALPIERSPLTGLFEAEYDRISIVHLAMGILILAFWMAVPRAAVHLKQVALWRGLVAVIGALVCAAIMYAIYPKFFHGPLADSDPALVSFWWSRVSELQPVMPTSLRGVGRFLLWVGPAATIVPWAVWKLWQQRRSQLQASWLFLTLILIVFVAATMRGLRFSAYAEIASLIPLLDLLATIRQSLGERVNLWQIAGRSFAAVAIAIGLPFAGLIVLNIAPAQGAAALSDQCPISAIAPLLDDPKQLGGRLHVIAAAIDDGPELMYRTPHAVVVTPIHNNSSILDTFRLMTAGDDAVPKAIIDRRHVDLILLCPGGSERGFFYSDKGEDTFYNRLVDGRLPSWIRPVPLPDDVAKHFRLFAVLPGPA